MVAYHFVNVVSATQSVFGDVFKIGNHQPLLDYFAAQTTTNDQNPANEIFSILRSIVRVGDMVIGDLASLSQGALRSTGSSAVVAKMADYVDDILMAITAHSRKYLDLQRDTVLKKTKAAHDKLLSTLVRLVLEILNSLGMGCEHHFDLFEGITWLVFQRAGCLIYILTHGHERCATVEAEIEQDQKANEAGKPSDTVKAAEVEAKYIFQLMKRIRQVAPHHYKLRFENNACKRTTVIPKSGTAKLTLDAKMKLQHTLIDSICGGRFDAYTDVICKPVMKPAAFTLPKAYSPGQKQSWFVKEIWTMYGWEILGKDVKE
jgi:hypothetical protein